VNFVASVGSKRAGRDEVLLLPWTNNKALRFTWEGCHVV
ncbi:hypothetical protein CCACVL1_30797, partial [Corchorus capsularis]